MLGEKLLGIGEAGQHQPAVAVGLIVEIGVGGEHAWRAAGCDERGMIGLVKRVELLLAFGQPARIEPGVMPQSVQRGDDARFQSPPPFAMLSRSASRSIVVRMRTISARSS